MSNRFYINEDEKRRISYLHKNETIRNFGRLLENVNPDIIDFFTKQTKGFKQWPKGTVIDFAQAGTKGYEVKNTDGTSYVLIPDGTAYVNDGSGYKKAENYTWTKTPYRDIPMKLEPKKLADMQLSQNIGLKNPAQLSSNSDAGLDPSALLSQQKNINTATNDLKSKHKEKCTTWYQQYKKTKRIRDNKNTLEDIVSKAEQNIGIFLKRFDEPVKLENGQTVNCRQLIRIID
jgi:hypothetical protein